MNLYRVEWIIKSTGSLTKDSHESTNIRANNEKEAIDRVKQQNPSSCHRMKDFKVKKIG